MGFKVQGVDVSNVCQSHVQPNAPDFSLPPRTVQGYEGDVKGSGVSLNENVDGIVGYYVHIVHHDLGHYHIAGFLKCMAPTRVPGHIQSIRRLHLQSSSTNPPPQSPQPLKHSTPRPKKTLGHLSLRPLEALELALVFALWEGRPYRLYTLSPKTPNPHPQNPSRTLMKSNKEPLQGSQTLKGSR